MNDNGNLPYQNLWDAVKALIQGELIILNTYAGKQKQSKINYPLIQLGKLEKQEQSKAKWRKKEIKRTETNEIKKRQQRKRQRQSLLIWEHQQNW